METSSMILLVVSCAISFGLGRTFVFFRDKKKRKAEDARKALAERQRADEPESKNKAKRKRQLQQGKTGKS
jgi:Flp pilus assembly protein TadB